MAMHRYGVTWLSGRQRRCMSDRAGHTWNEIFSGLPQHAHVVWFDNYNAVGMPQTQRGQECPSTAQLCLCSACLLYWQSVLGCPPLRICFCCVVHLAALFGMSMLLQEGCTIPRMPCHAHNATPLYFTCAVVRRPPWHPFLLASQQNSSNADGVSLL